MNGEYVNFDFGISLVSLDMILIAGVLAMTIAAVFALYNKRFVGGIVRTLIARGALSEESALPVDALSGKARLLYRFALRPETTVRRYVARVGEGAEAPATGKRKKRKKAPFLEAEAARYYVPAEVRDRAELRYAAKGTNVVTVVLGLVFMVGLAFALRWLIPQVLGSLDSTITYIKSNMR